MVRLLLGAAEAAQLWSARPTRYAPLSPSSRATRLRVPNYLQRSRRSHRQHPQVQSDPTRRTNKALRNECFGKIHYNIEQLEEVRLCVKLFTAHYIHERWHMGLPDLMAPRQFKEYYTKSPEAAILELAKVGARSLG